MKHNPAKKKNYKAKKARMHDKIANKKGYEKERCP